MATVTITGGTADGGALGDNRPWKFWAAVYQADGAGGVITTSKDRAANILRPVAGVLSFEVQPGIAGYLENPDGKRYLVTTPAVDTPLWDVIEAAVAFPPDTSQELLSKAVDQYVIDNADSLTFDDVEIAGTGSDHVQFMRGGNPVGDPLPLPSAAWGSIAAKPDIEDDGAGGVVVPYMEVEGGQTATTSVRFVGKTATEYGPESGTWAAGDLVQDQFGGWWKCVAGGTPGTWHNATPGFMDQVANEFQYGATWITADYTLSATPQTIDVNDASNFPAPVGAVQTPIVIGTGQPQLSEPKYVQAYYTGVSGNTLTGVVTRDGSTQEVTQNLRVWYAKSGLAAAYLRIPNGIIARSGIDGRPHDLVLVASRDDTRTGDDRADYDIIFTREAGSYGVCHFALPIKFPRDGIILDGSNSPLLAFAASIEAETNSMTQEPMPTGSIYVYGRFEGRNGSSDNLVFRNSGETNSKIEFQNQAGMRLFHIDEVGLEVANNVELRFRRGDGSGYGSIIMSAGNTMVFRSPSANGFVFNNNANSATRFSLTDAGLATFNGHIAAGGSAPSIAAGGGAGVSPTVSVTGNDIAGMISVTTGASGVGSGQLAQVTFASAFGSTVKSVQLQPKNATAAALSPYVTPAAATFTVQLGAAPAVSTTYEWMYQVVG